MRNILLNLSYNGKNYHGWQIQKNAVTVQEVFQKALKKIIKEKLDIKGCSRTDSGVHANMYCISFKTNSEILCEKFPLALNKYLPNDIAVNSCCEVPLDFHARYSCTSKEYIYKIWNARVRNPFLDGRAFHYWYPLDVELLNIAAKEFLGTYDFSAFCTQDKRIKQNLVRTVKNFEVLKDGNFVIFKVEADGFLYNMVRIMVGTLLNVSRGRTKVEDIKNIILSKDRSKAGPTAVPYGLYLNKVFYEGENYD